MKADHFNLDSNKESHSSVCVTPVMVYIHSTAVICVLVARRPIHFLSKLCVLGCSLWLL